MHISFPATWKIILHGSELVDTVTLFSKFPNVATSYTCALTMVVTSQFPTGSYLSLFRRDCKSSLGKNPMNGLKTS